MKKLKHISRDVIEQLPKATGVYCFKSGREILYIGKAINIRERVNQHRKLLSLVKRVGFIKTDSEIEALILEANLIKKYKPKYNVVWKDDKNYFYVGVTKEDYPKVFITHQIKTQSSKLKTQNYNSKLKTIYVGPFVEGNSLKQTLKVLRKVFAYRSCNKIPKHPCLWYQLNRCLAPCLLKTKMRNECQRNTKNLVKILQGKKAQALKDLKKEMERASKFKNFEKAAEIRDQITAFEKVILNSRILEPAGLLETKLPLEWQFKRKRIEAYDVSNIQGKEATGSMVVFTEGKPDKNQYRKFKIKKQGRPNDVAMIKEILSRRLRHPEWPYPDLILIDGGKAQLNAVSKCLKWNFKHIIKVMAIAKKKNELYVEARKNPILLKSLPREIFNLISQLRDEAHRFALSYHRKLRKKNLLPD